MTDPRPTHRFTPDPDRHGAFRMLGRHRSIGLIRGYDGDNPDRELWMLRGENEGHTTNTLLSGEAMATLVDLFFSLSDIPIQEADEALFDILEGAVQGFERGSGPYHLRGGFLRAAGGFDKDFLIANLRIMFNKAELYDASVAENKDA